MKTGFQSVKLSIAGFIVPYMFVYSPQLMPINTTWAEGVWVTLSACLGVFLIAIATEGYVYARMNVVYRIVATIGAFCLIKSGIETDIIGLVIMLVIIFLQKKKAKALLMAKAS